MLLNDALKGSCSEGQKKISNKYRPAMEASLGTIKVPSDRENKMQEQKQK